MVTFGDDSLNEHSEDRDPANMDSLRMKLGKPPDKPKDYDESEPTREQLIATGELGPGGGEGPPEGGEAPGSAPEGEKTPTSLTTTEEKLSVRRQIEQRALAGATQDELIAEGFNKRSVQTIFSELKARGKISARAQSGRAVTTTADGLPVFAKGSPPEAIIGNLQMPDVSNGQGPSFEQGMKFGLSVAVLGIRMAQELSGIGIMQAKPLLDMARSMREGEAMAAKNAAGEAAMEAAGMVQQYMAPILTNLQRSSGGEGGDPVKAMMVRTMEPIMQKLMGSMLGRLAPGTQQPQLTQGEGKIEGWTRRSE